MRVCHSATRARRPILADNGLSAKPAAQHAAGGAADDSGRVVGGIVQTAVIATFTVRIDTALPPDQAWRRIWDLDAHSRVIPLTRLSGHGTGGGELLPGDCFIARTGVGPLGVDDVMHVVEFEPPEAENGHQGHAVVHKRGRVVKGRIDATVTPRVGGSVLTWTQDIGLLGVPSLADPAVSRVAKTAYTTVLQALLEGR